MMKERFMVLFYRKRQGLYSLEGSGGGGSRVEGQRSTSWRKRRRQGDNNYYYDNEVSERIKSSHRMLY